MNINELIEEAGKCLREADPLCSEANAFFAESCVLVEQSTILWSRILFLHSAQVDQLQSMGNLCLIIKTAVDKAQHDCATKIKGTKHSRTGLRALLDILRDTNVDMAFGSQQTLYQYVHEEDIAKLESQVDKLADQINRTHAEIENLPAQTQQQLGDLRANIPELQPVIQNAIPKVLVKIKSKVAPHVSKMADLLDSLTQHYDLCSTIPDLPSAEASEAIKVVMGDRERALQAIEELKDCRNQLRLKHRECQRIQNSLDMAFEQHKGFEDLLTSCINENLKPALIAVQRTNQVCQGFFDHLSTLTNELVGLTEYYRLFRKSYHALIVEIGRRQESAKQLKKVVENANNAFHGFQSRETEMRQAFVQTYREYLPEELWSGVAEMPKKYSVQFEPETLPSLSKSTFQTAFKEHNV